MSLAKPDVFELIADVEARIGSLRYGDSYSMYETMYEAAARLGPIGSFYVCLYNAESETLNFAYNREGDTLEDPVTVPLGSGPTSWVIEKQRPFLLSKSNLATQRAGLSFGDTSRVSNSAVHLPMRTIGADGGRQLVGVMSAQSYEHDVFGASEIELLQALADRAGRILHDDAGHVDCRRRIAALEVELERRHDRAIRITSDFVEHLSAAAHEAYALLGMTPGDLPDLQRAEAALHRSLHKILTMAAEAPTYLEDEHREPPSRSEIGALPSAGLTKRELEIAVLLANGRSNASMAESLFISVDTVKFHCANLYRKLGVRNRVQAVQAATALILDRAT